MERYEEKKVIGRGNFGTALLVKDVVTGRPCVVKRIPLSLLSEKERGDAERECKLLATLRHANILEYIDSFLGDETLHLVTEYCEAGDMGTLIKKTKKSGGSFSEGQIVDWFCQIAMAVDHIHSLNIIHRDLKTGNVFLTKSNVIKLGDFGIAKVLDSTLEQANTVVGTPYFMSPEVCEDKKYDSKSDLWALGCILYELCMLSHAFDASNLLGLVVKIVQEDYAPISTRYSAELRDLVRQLLSKRPDARPSCRKIFRLQFIRAKLVELAEKDEREHQRSSGAGGGGGEEEVAALGPGPEEASGVAAGVVDERKRRTGRGREAGLTAAAVSSPPPPPPPPPPPCSSEDGPSPTDLKRERKEVAARRRVEELKQAALGGFKSRQEARRRCEMQLLPSADNLLAEEWLGSDSPRMRRGTSVGSEATGDSRSYSMGSEVFCMDTASVTTADGPLSPSATVSAGSARSPADHAMRHLYMHHRNSSVDTQETKSSEAGNSSYSSSFDTKRGGSACASDRRKQDPAAAEKPKQRQIERLQGHARRSRAGSSNASASSGEWDGSLLVGSGSASGSSTPAAPAAYPKKATRSGSLKRNGSSASYSSSASVRSDLPVSDQRLARQRPRSSRPTNRPRSCSSSVSGGERTPTSLFYSKYPPSISIAGSFQKERKVNVSGGSTGVNHLQKGRARSATMGDNEKDFISEHRAIRATRPASQSLSHMESYDERPIRASGRYSLEHFSSEAPTIPSPASCSSSSVASVNSVTDNRPMSSFSYSSSSTGFPPSLGRRESHLSEASKKSGHSGASYSPSSPLMYSDDFESEGDFQLDDDGDGDGDGDGDRDEGEMYDKKEAGGDCGKSRHLADSIPRLNSDNSAQPKWREIAAKQERRLRHALGNDKFDQVYKYLKQVHLSEGGVALKSSSSSKKEKYLLRQFVGKDKLNLAFEVDQLLFIEQVYVEK